MADDPTGLQVTLFVTLFAMVRVTWHECVTFRLDPNALSLAGIGTGALILLTGGPEMLTEALMTGCIAAALTDIARLWKPMAVGQGDVTMMGLIGFAAGPDHAVLALFAFGVFCVLIATAYGIIRGRRLMYVVFPVALPGMGVAAFALALRLNDTFDLVSLPAGYDPLRQAAYEIPPILVLITVFWAIGAGFIVLNRKRIGIWATRAAS